MIEYRGKDKVTDLDIKKKKRVQVKIEVGHQAISKENPTNLFTHDWTTFVRGADGADISHFVERVVFHLHESFTKPRRVCKEPPFRVSEQGYGSFTLPIEIYFRNKEEPRKYSVNYELTLQLRGLPPLNCTKVEALTFLNPSDEFEKKLISGGAVVLNPGTAKRPNTSEEAVQKPKKKKHEYATTDITTPPTNPVLKEISILSGANDPDPVKAKNGNTSVKKVKEERQRRRSTEEAPTKSSIKETKHKVKESKSKKEKKQDRKISPNSYSNDGTAPTAMKFTLKRTIDESWSAMALPKDDPNHIDQKPPVDTLLTTTPSTVLINNVTTASQQNDHVNKVIAQFAEEDENSGDNMTIALPDHVKPTPDQLLSSYISSNDSIGSSSKPPSKKSSKTNKSNSTIKAKTVKETDRKTRTKPLVTLTTQELTDMCKKLNDLEDSDILQGVVDIVESSGQFEISATTFDFDLCTLEPETVSAIKEFLDNS